MDDVLKKISLDRLTPSTTNPRTRFDERSMLELSVSIQSNGIFKPLLVRPVGAKYEIVDGERRWKAAKKLELPEVPCHIRDMTDDEVLTAQLVSFIQTVDITPLEEARAFERYCDNEKRPVTNADISLRFGKTPQYVAQRRQLTKLIQIFKDLLCIDRITLNAAIEISKLPPKQQDELHTALKKHGISYDTDDITELINEKFLLDLHRAPFKKDDDTLLPKAGSCTKCQKNSGALPDLFGDIKKKLLCQDAGCFNAKLNAFVELKEKEYADDGNSLIRIVDDYCDYNKYGGIGTNQYSVDSSKNAKTFGIYVNPEDKGKIIGIQLASDQKKNNQAKGEKKEPDMQSRLKHWRRRMEIHNNRIDFEARKRLMKDVFPRIKSVSKEDLEVIIQWMFAKVVYHGKEKDWVMESMNIKAMKTDGLNSHLLVRMGLGIVLASTEMNDDPTMRRPPDKRFRDIAKRYGVNFNTITRQVASEMKSKEPRKPIAKKDNQPKPHKSEERKASSWKH